MIVENVDSIDKGFNHMATKQRIVSVAFCKPVKEEDHAIAVKQLGLGIAEHLDGKPEIFRLIFQFFQHGRGGGIPDTGGDGVIDVPDLFLGFRIFRFHGGERRALHFFRLEGHDHVGVFFDVIFRKHMIQDEIDDAGLQIILLEGLLAAAFPGLPRLT